MGSLKLPETGSIYFDADAMIYSVEKIYPYLQVLDPIWKQAESGRIDIICSDLILIECLVGPMRERDSVLEAVYRDLLISSNEVQLIAIERSMIERAAIIRAHTGLKTPDAVHAATALEMGVAMFVTNDPVFTRVSDLPVVILSEVIS